MARHDGRRQLQVSRWLATVWGNAEAQPLRKEGATIMWARRLIVASGLAVASLAVASGSAGAACTSTGSMTQPSCVTTPTVAANSTTPAPPAAPVAPRHDPVTQS